MQERKLSEKAARLSRLGASVKAVVVIPLDQVAANDASAAALTQAHMNDPENEVVSSIALLAATVWAAEPPPKVSLIGRPVPEIDSLREGPYLAMVMQVHELSTHTFAVIGPEAKNSRKRYAGKKSGLHLVSPGGLFQAIRDPLGRRDGHVPAVAGS